MVLEARDLVVKYGEVTVIRDLTLSVEAGEILGVLGRNGMGKTTLMRAIAGTLPVAGGTLTFAGRDVRRLPPYERARLGMSLVPQGRGIFPGLTVRDNLEMGRVAARDSDSEARFQQVLEYFPILGQRLGQRAGSMSGGEQQMLAIGRALMTGPKLLLLDEPSFGIMPMVVKQITQIIRDINQQEGLTTIIVEQNVPMVFSAATRCIILEEGTIVAEGTPEELDGSPVMKQHLAI